MPAALGPHRAAATGNPFLARPLWEDSSMQPAAVPDDEAPEFDPAAASSQHDSMDVVEEQPDGGAAGERVPLLSSAPHTGILAW